MPPAPGGDQLELVFCRLRLIVDELLVHGREQPVIEIRLIPCFKRLRPLVCLRHGVGSDGGEIDHHAAPGQHQIECLDHIDRTGRIDTDNIFRRRVARRDAGGMDDLRHVTEGSGELRQRLHLRAIRDVCFARTFFRVPYRLPFPMPP